MDSYINPEEFIADQQKQAWTRPRRRRRSFPRSRQRDILAFFLFRMLRWSRGSATCLEIVRGEAYYFAPQAMTKIMNEGWATYWHSKIMTEKALNTAEIIDYADACAGVLATSPGRLNPYKLGVELFRHIESRWNRGQFGQEWDECDSLEAKREWDRRLGLGRDKIFEVRKLYNDVTFIDEFFTLEFCLEQKFYSFGYNERSGNWEIMSREHEKVKSQLLKSLTNRGQPFIYVEDANFENRGELLLRHSHEGADLDLAQARDTLENLYRVWTRPVSVLTRIEGKGKYLRYDEEGYSDKPGEYPAS